VQRGRRRLIYQRRAEAVPEGSAATVLAWVADDAQRAQLALEAERDGKQRSTLIAKLERIAAT
jgi:hypothetical protein